MKELRVKFLKLVLAELEKSKASQIYNLGICFEIDCLQWKHERKEVSTFKIWFSSQKPHSNLHSKFTKHEHWLGGEFWWVRTQEGLNQRILFIKHLIEKQS
jgi:hypothetical protein